MEVLCGLDGGTLWVGFDVGILTVSVLNLCLQETKQRIGHV